MPLNQITLLNKLLAVTYFVTLVFGLWPYNIEKSTKSSHYSIFKLIYSIALPCFVTYNYYTFGIVILASQGPTDQVFHSKIMGLTAAIYGMLTMFCYSVVYVRQHMRHSTRQLVYMKCRKIVRFLRTFAVDGGDFTPCFVKVLVKVIVLEVCSFASLWFNVTRSANLLALHPYLPMFLYAPMLTVRLYENLFYGGMLLLHIVFKRINENVQKLVAARKYSEFYQKSSVTNYCQLSDELDKLSNLHVEVSETVRVFNSIFDVHVGLYIILEMSGILLRCFYQCVDVMYLLSTSENYGNIIAKNIFNFSTVMFRWIELSLTSNACGSVADEANRTGEILQTAKTIRKVDVRLRRSIDHFSMRILLNQLKITSFGMITINYRTVYLAGATICSYFFMLVQFELANRRK